MKLINRLGHPLTPKKLRKILRYDPEQSAKDIKRATAEGHVFSLHDQERAEYLMNSARLKSWLTSPESQFLLINGNAEHSRISPASFACGILASSTLSSKQTLTLSYFCGLHTDSRDEERGAPKLLASLLGQLLSQYDSFDLSFLKSSKQKALKKLPVKLLCKVLAKLLRQLPKGYVALCMIDGISFYEGRGLRDDTRRAIEVLLDLVDDEELGAVVKVVVTSAAMSTEVVKDVAKDAVFNVPVEMDYKNQGFGSRVLGKGAQRQGKGLAHERKGKYQWSMDSSDETDSSDGGSESGSSDEDAAGVHSDTL